MQSKNIRHGIRIAAVVFACLAVFFVYWRIAGTVQFCVFRLVTGLPCPGCGLTHAAFALVQGDWRASLQYHPLLIPVLGIITVALLKNGIPFCARLHESRWFYLTALIILLGLYIARMILFFPEGPAPMVFDDKSFAGKLLGLF